MQAYYIRDQLLLGCICMRGLTANWTFWDWWFNLRYTCLIYYIVPFFKSIYHTFAPSLSHQEKLKFWVVAWTRNAPLLWPPRHSLIFILSKCPSVVQTHDNQREWDQGCMKDTGRSEISISLWCHLKLLWPYEGRVCVFKRICPLGHSSLVSAGIFTLLLHSL